MNDAPQQSNGYGEHSLASALGERLSKRATEPVGVIDVRYAEEKYLRIVRWLARCNALVDHLTRRYGVEVARTHGEHVFAAQHRLAEVNVFSPTVSPHAEVQDAPSDAPLPGRGLASIISERSYADEPPILLQSSFRIRRPSPPRSPELDASAGSPRAGHEQSPQQPTGDAGVSAAPITQISGFVFRNEVEAGSSVAGLTDVRRQVAGEKRVERVEGPNLAATIETQERRPSAALWNEKSPPVSTARQDRKGANASPVSLPPPGTAIDSPHSLPPLPAVRGAVPSRPESGDSIERRDTGSSRTSSAASSEPLAFEIPIDSSSREMPNLVWRDHQDDPRTVRSTALGSRAVSAPSGKQSGPVEFIPVTQQNRSIGSLAPAQIQGQEVKAEDISPQVIRSISERVIRAITLDLKLERERRGVTKWR